MKNVEIASNIMGRRMQKKLGCRKTGLEPVYAQSDNTKFRMSSTDDKV
jgi:hypothetical protein